MSRVRMNRWSVRRALPHLLVLVALVGIVTYGSRATHDGAQAVRYLATAPCRLDHGVCRVHPDADTSIALTVAPRPVPAGTPFVATAVVEGLTARSVELEFEGTDMNMGLFRQALAARSPGTFESDVTLPLCATGAMRWQARLIVRTESGTLVVPFDLTTGRQGDDGISLRGGARRHPSDQDRRA